MSERGEHVEQRGTLGVRVSAIVSEVDIVGERTMHIYSANAHSPYITFHPLLTLTSLTDLFVLPHLIFHMFLLPPRLSVAKLSGSQLLWLGTLFHKILLLLLL